jgi:hypothetical protein
MSKTEIFLIEWTFILWRLAHRILEKIFLPWKIFRTPSPCKETTTGTCPTSHWWNLAWDAVLERKASPFSKEGNDHQNNAFLATYLSSDSFPCAKMASPTNWSFLTYFLYPEIWPFSDKIRESVIDACTPHLTC